MLEEFLLIGFAAWRVTAFLAYERGPGDVFLQFRSLFGIRHNQESGEPESWPSRFLPRLLVCPWCLGVWVTAAIWGLWQIAPPLVLILAASALLLSVERWNHGKS